MLPLTPLAFLLQSSTIDFALCLNATSEEQYAARTRKAKRPPGVELKPLDKKDEIVANVIWRFLDLRGWVAAILFLCLSPSRVAR